VGGSLNIDVSRSDRVVIVRPSGLLDAQTSAELCDLLLDLLADQVGAVVVDAAGVTVIGTDAVEALAAVARQNRVWPRVPLLLVGGGPALAAVGAAGEGKPDEGKADEDTGAAGSAGRPLLVFVDRDAALAHLGGVAVPATRRLRLRPEPEAPGLARAAVHEFCESQGVCGEGERGPNPAAQPAEPPHAAQGRDGRDAAQGRDGRDAARWRGGREVAQLVVSELVTNAVVHAGTPIDLTLRLVPGEGHALLHLGVRDGLPVAPIPAPASPPGQTADGGRGLLVVAAFADEWGTCVSHAGKVVWATVPVDLCL